jgi:hypothetical protein
MGPPRDVKWGCDVTQSVVGRELEWGSVGAMGPEELGLLLMWLGCDVSWVPAT